MNDPTPPLPRPLRVLLVEDTPDDAVLLVRVSDGVLTMIGVGVGTGVAAAAFSRAPESPDGSAPEQPPRTARSISIGTTAPQR